LNFAVLQTWETECLKSVDCVATKYSGYGVGLETVIGPIEIKHTWSPKPKKDIRGLVLDFYFKFNLYQ
jgi:NTE family protein